MSDTSAKPAVHPVVAVLAWLWALVPFGYGLYGLLIKVPALFGS
ncbi:MAG: hypothetical protein QOG20_6188 [Pseudonocardiales bacterium]|jgi:hypothetical protein|nr:hypothetical protein [Pseudonocardiales bacterium]